jgi:L-threonylcarbamoyladenylate synthase
MTEGPLVLPIDVAGALDAAAGALTAGELVVLPTETVYGIACALDPVALARLVEAKDRSIDKGITLLVNDLGQALPLARIPRAADRLARRFWPGPLTLVLPARPEANLPGLVTGGLGTVGFRSPAVAEVRALARRLGPLPLTSANRSGERDATTATEALAVLGQRVALVLDGGPSPGGVPSTVLAVSDGPEPPRILRRGALGPEAIARALGEDSRTGG